MPHPREALRPPPGGEPTRPAAGTRPAAAGGALARLAAAALAVGAIACASGPPPFPEAERAGAAAREAAPAPPGGAPASPAGAGAPPAAPSVQPGLGAAEVRRRWGPPDAVRTVPSPSVPGLAYERWIWDDGREAVLVDGRVVDVLAPPAP